MDTNKDSLANSANVNIPKLLVYKDFDLREVSKNNPTMQASVYFKKVGDFVDESPTLIANLNSIKNKTAKQEVFKDLLSHRALAKDLGMVEFVGDIQTILDAGRALDTNLQSESAEKALNNLKKIVERTKSAYMVSNMLGERENIFARAQRNVSQTLKVILDQIDEADADRKLRILIVDDSRTMVRSVMNVLEDTYEIFALTRGKQVEKFLENTVPELFLLDIEMPDMNGLDLIPIIRGFRQHHDTPIFYLTGHATIKNLVHSYDLGAVDFVVKPIEPNVLLKKVAKKIVRKPSF